MRKKTKLFILLGALVFAIALSGTIAYFTSEFSSEDNTATAATFDVDVVNSNGETIGNGDFDLGEDLYPGMEQREVYSFNINKNNTELPVEYSVNLNASGDLFPSDGDSPVVLTMERMINDDWEEVDHSETFMPENDTEQYRILVNWPHGDNDIDFQGATGDIALEVVATQVDGEDNDGPMYTGEIDWKSSSFDWNHHTTSNQEIEFETKSDGLKEINVYITDDENFSEAVGDFSITEYEAGLYRVVSEHDTHTMPNGGWIVEDGTIDTSEDGVVIFYKRDRYHNPNVDNLDISIESDDLHDWFTN
ncbi:hypothetical protein [Alkalibacillus haloalkaliphilus]|uniref:hypothetical protein n=1 Tax=Alkalibacillus haloalkaliphilus TaxID=94136 RepID=UPI0002D3BC95|nr:hypothetical protein [Alkalibacillus haloalkaliphilus]